MINFYMRYFHRGDEIKWEFVKYSVYKTFLASYFGSKTYFNFVYPSTAVSTKQINNYYEELFEIVYDFDFKLTDQVLFKSDKLSYINKIMYLDDTPTMYLDNLISVHNPTSLFNIKQNTVYFLSKKEERTNKFSIAYEKMGIFDAVFDDRVIIVPKTIAKDILDNIKNIQDLFQYNDEFIENICQYVIQTHAIINNVPIETLDQNCFVEFNEDLGVFLSSKAPLISG